LIRLDLALQILPQTDTELPASHPTLSRLSQHSH
jgi:hypothetical protein